MRQSGDSTGSIGETLGMLELKLADADDLARICPEQWDALSDSALDPNPFYSRRYMAAGLATIDRDTRLRALTQLARWARSSKRRVAGFRRRRTKPSRSWADNCPTHFVEIYTPRLAPGRFAIRDAHRVRG